MKYFMLVLLVLLTIAPLTTNSVSAQDTIIGSKVSVKYTASPDSRVTGHYLYLQNMTDQTIQRVDMGMVTDFVIPKENVTFGTEYKVHATAYGTISGKEHESVPSNSVSFILISPFDPPVIIELYCN